jgi:rhodanese-related sulfurtransferase
MAHPATSEASSAPANRGDAVEAVQDFITEQFLGGADEPEEEETNEIPEGEEPEGEQPEGDEPEGETDEQDQQEAQVEPIQPPVSMSAEDAELFKQLTPDMQKWMVERSAQQEKLVQQRTTEAANAKRTASAEANAAVAELQRNYASHLEQLASQFAPQPPRRTDYATADEYLFAKDAYDIRAAQHQHMMQQAEVARQEAEKRDAITRNEEIAKNAQALADHFGDTWNDNTQRQALLTELQSIGAELGYPEELMREASATDIIALAKANEWKAKAAKYDQLQKTKMEAVRAARGAPRVSKPGTAQTKGDVASRNRDAAWAAVKSSGGRSGDAAAAFLESMGINLG